MKKKQSTIQRMLNDQFKFDRKNTAIFFIGVGITMLLLNLVTVAHSMYFLFEMGTAIKYPFSAFYVSTFSAILLIIYALHNLYVEE